MNKKIIKAITSTILMASMMLVGTSSKATVENKPGGTVHTSITVSESYELCYNMRTEALGNNSLDPHLTTNADWAAAAYLGLSVYGNVRSKTGTAVTIDGTSYNSTTNNITGVMNMGKNYTQTASLITGYKDTGYIGNLKTNLNTKYVETLGATYDDASNKGRAYGETYGWYSSTTGYANASYPVGIRTGVLGFNNNSNNNNGSRRCLFHFTSVLIPINRTK